MKVWEKVNNLTGYNSKSRVLVELLNQASKFLVASLPEKFLWSIASEETVQGWNSDGDQKIGNGSGTAYDKIISVYRFQDGKKRIAREVSDSSSYSFDEKDSILRATKMFPKYYRLADKIFIKPDPDYNAHSVDKSYTDIYNVSIPVVVRLEGTNAKEAAELLEKSSLEFLVATSLADAAEKAVAAVTEGAQ